MSDDIFAMVFGELRALMLAALTPAQRVTEDLPGSLVVKQTETTGGGIDAWFGTVTIKKSYVAYHLMPLYDHPQLAQDLGEALGRRRQGKTCFNFKRSDAELFAELAGLTARAARHPKADG